MWGRLPVKIFKKPLDQCGNVQGSAVLFADFLLVWKFVGHFFRKCVIISLQAISANVVSGQTLVHTADSFFFALLSAIYYTTITKFVIYKNEDNYFHKNLRSI